jgi:hypothetical protein
MSELERAWPLGPSGIWWGSAGKRSLSHWPPGFSTYKVTDSVLSVCTSQLIYSKRWFSTTMAKLQGVLSHLQFSFQCHWTLSVKLLFPPLTTALNHCQGCQLSFPPRPPTPLTHTHTMSLYLLPICAHLFGLSLAQNQLWSLQTHTLSTSQHTASAYSQLSRILSGKVLSAGSGGFPRLCRGLTFIPPCLPMNCIIGVVHLPSPKTPELCENRKPHT